MAPVKKSSKGDKYSVILPTFNERQNLPIITWLLNRTFTEKYATCSAFRAISMSNSR
jgi:dolichol-phosphate mannosyltransferase